MSEDVPKQVIEREKRPVEVVDELPQIAVENQIIYNNKDRYFYIGKDEKEVN